MTRPIAVEVKLRQEQIAQKILETTLNVLEVEDPEVLFSLEQKESTKYKDTMMIISLVARSMDIPLNRLAACTNRSYATVKLYANCATSNLSRNNFKYNLNAVRRKMGLPALTDGKRKLFTFTPQEETKIELAKLGAKAFMEKYAKPKKMFKPSY